MTCARCYIRWLKLQVALGKQNLEIKDEESGKAYYIDGGRVYWHHDEVETRKCTCSSVP